MAYPILTDEEMVRDLKFKALREVHLATEELTPDLLRDDDGNECWSGGLSGCMCDPCMERSLVALGMAEPQGEP